VINCAPREVHRVPALGCRLTIHLRKAVEEGSAHGGKVGNYAVDSVLRPVR
jgi:hypothetical protein